ncbi:MAG: hypothetical protein COA44_03825 [Arcobacter sp.]|nr:MAG: hypothetical protein COA44_03825 [Arcobacter sp.]
MKKYVLILLLTKLLFGVPAIDSEITFVQADGSNFKAFLQGDEYFNWVQTKDGYLTQYNSLTKNYEFMILNTQDELIFSNVKVPTETKQAFSQVSQVLPSNIKKIPSEKLELIWKKRWEEAHPKKVSIESESNSTKN